MSSPFLSTLSRLGTPFFLKIILMIIVLPGLGLLAKQPDFRGILDSFAFAPGAGNALLEGPLGFVLLAGVLVSFGAPRQLVSFFAAYTFGLYSGFGLALIATVLGCITAYSLAGLFSGLAKKIISGKTVIVLKFWRENVFPVTLLIRLMPAGSNLITNLAAGTTGIPPLRFFAGSALGYIPQTIVFAVMGSGVNLESGLQIAISIALFIGSLALGLWIYIRNRRYLKVNSADAS